MKKKPYKKRPGDLEIRLLKDGRLVLVGPDESLVEIARDMDGPGTKTARERTGHGTQSGETDPSGE